MNEKIKELMIQSYETRIDIFSNEEYNSFSREKFAELIIRECAEIALTEDDNPYYSILSHFGFE